MKKKFICTICGYMHEGTEAPAECPVCHAKADKFQEFDGEALKGSKTEKNLQDAFAGESQARGKYTYFASKAKKEGYQQIAAIFEETALNEQEHAKLWFKFLHGAEIPSTDENLKLPPRARTTNGPTCTTVWPRRLKKRASSVLQPSSAR